MTIAELEDGSVGVITGRVVAATQTVPGPEGAEYVFHDRGRAGEGPRAEAFWVEDESGRVLVPTPYEVRGGAMRQSDRIDVIDADVKQVSARLSDIKEARRQLRGGEGDAKLLKEQRALKQLATVLCCIRAHENGRVHGGSRSFEAQAIFIQTRGEALRAGGHALRSIELALEVRQVVVAVGDEVVVEAAFREGPVPPGLGPTGGYRSRPICLQAVKPIRVTPTAESHAAEIMAERERREREGREDDRLKRRSAAALTRSRGTSPVQLAGGVLLVVLVVVYLYMVM